MRAAVESRLASKETFVSHIDLCLGCRACETVCPSGVPYGRLLEAARAEASSVKKEAGSLSESLLRSVLIQLFSRPSVLRIAFWLARQFRDSGMARLAFESRLLGERATFALALLLASSPSKWSTAEKPKHRVRSSVSERRPSVSVLKGCVMEGLFGHVNISTELVMEANGFETRRVDGQGCCGALHAHAGYHDAALQLARRNINAFLDSGCERVVVNAAGCGAAMKEYTAWLADDPEFAEKARRFSASVRDISELLAEFSITPPGDEVPCTVAYDAPCHLIHAQRVAEPPLAMLRAVPGLRLVALPDAQTCCGGAGIYNLQHPELSHAILQKKIESIKSTCAELLATGNPGCIMQIGAGLLLAGSEVTVVHPVEVLCRAYLIRQQPVENHSGSENG
jgi:glycolate oxidase iron-sulfur subunit